jgi:hypothetical protein
MRKMFLENCKSSREARKLAPWAAKVIKTDNGYWAFESSDDARIWRRQK